MGRINHSFKVATSLLRAMPASDALRVLAIKAVHAATGRFAGRQVMVRVHGLPGRTAIRVQGSDFATFRQVFCLRDYDFKVRAADTPNVLDCGGNVGYASLALYRSFRPKHMVVVEPDSRNLDQCRINLAQLPVRVELVQAAIWTDNTPLEVVRASGEHNAAAFYVRPVADPVEGGLTGVTMSSLIDRFDGDVDVLKMDIEGAELGVLNAADTRWIDRVRNFFVELHGPACVEACERVMAGYDADRVHRGEVTAWLSIRPKT